MGISIFFYVILHYIKLLVTLRLFSDALLHVTCNQSDIIEGGTLSETRLGLILDNMKYIAIFAVICNIFHNIKDQTALREYLGFYFENNFACRGSGGNTQRYLRENYS